METLYFSSETPNISLEISDIHWRPQIFIEDRQILVLGVSHKYQGSPMKIRESPKKISNEIVIRVSDSTPIDDDFFQDSED